MHLTKPPADVDTAGGTTAREEAEQHVDGEGAEAEPAVDGGKVERRRRVGEEQHQWREERGAQGDDGAAAAVESGRRPRPPRAGREPPPPRRGSAPSRTGETLRLRGKTDDQSERYERTGTRQNS